MVEVLKIENLLIENVSFAELDKQRKALRRAVQRIEAPADSAVGKDKERMEDLLDMLDTWSASYFTSEKIIHERKLNYPGQAIEVEWQLEPPVSTYATFEVTLTVYEVVQGKLFRGFDKINGVASVPGGVTNDPEIGGNFRNMLDNALEALERSKIKCR